MKAEQTSLESSVYNYEIGAYNTFIEVVYPITSRFIERPVTRFHNENVSRV
jgi:hypothetical protein